MERSVDFLVDHLEIFVNSVCFEVYEFVFDGAGRVEGLNSILEFVYHSAC